MEARHIKIPTLAEQLAIPKDRIYKWYQQGTKPKASDAMKVWDWINGEISNIVEEPQADYKTKYIELLERTLQEKEQRIRELEGMDTPDIRKKVSG